MMKKLILLSSASLLITIAGFSQNVKKVKLWENTPPTQNGITEPENITKEHWITNVSVPELTIYSPEKSKNTGMAVIICPGGGYAGLASMHEGEEVAQWLNSIGITGIVLKYRMPNKHKEIPLDDTWQAIRYARENAFKLGLKPDKIGIAGFSAGGHLASTTSTHFSTGLINTRPDFSILFYPVITMTELTHGGSRINLLGDEPSKEDIYLFSNENQVNNNTPPTILFHSDDDDAVPVLNSIHYYEALKMNNVPASLYIFPEGRHGWGMKKDFKYHEQMLSLLKEWLERQK